MYTFFFVISFLLLNNNSYAAYTDSPKNNQSKSCFLNLPDEIIYIIMITLIKNDDFEGLSALASTNTRLNKISKKNPYINLPLIDQSIEFEYHFTENSDGSCHEQNYRKFPLNTINTKKMLFIISNMKKLYTKDTSKTAKQIAQELKCFQYIIFHEEYCFRAILVNTRCAWRGNYDNFISQTCDSYIGFFDQNYILGKDFFQDFDTLEWQANKKAWAIEKIKNSDSKNAKLDLSKYTIKTNKKKWSDTCAVIKIDFPSSLFNLIVTIASHDTSMKQDETFETYLTNLFNNYNPEGELEKLRLKQEQTEQQERKKLLKLEQEEDAKLNKAEQQRLQQEKELKKLQKQKEQLEKELEAKLKEKANMDDQLKQKQEQQLNLEQEDLRLLQQMKELEAEQQRLQQEKELKREEEELLKLEREAEKNQFKKFISNNIVKYFLLITSLLFIKKIFSIFFNILHSFKGAQL